MGETQIKTTQIADLTAFVEAALAAGAFTSSQITDFEAALAAGVFTSSQISDFTAAVEALIPEGGSGGGSTATRVRRAAAGQSIPNNASTQLQWDTGDLDSVDSYDAANNTRWVCPADGTYLIVASVRFTASHGGVFGFDFSKNGAAVGSYLWPGSTTSPPPATLVQFHQLLAGDYFTMGVYQNSGSAKTIDTASTSIVGMLLGGGGVGGTPVEFNFIEKNATPAGVTGTVGNTGEIVVADMDVQLPTVGAVVEIDGLYYWSQLHSQTPKTVKVRLRRDGLAGAELASDQQAATIDSSGGHDRSWLINYTDNAPTTGRYVITVEPVAGNSTSTIYSDTRQFQALTAVTLLTA